jgi:hypothetical protein
VNKFRLSFALLAALLVAVPFAALAGDDAEVKHQVKIKIVQDGDLIDVEADDLEVGESREFKSESGKDVVITRTEEGFDVTVDGKKIELLQNITNGEGGGHRVIRIEKRTGDGEDVEVEKEHKIVVLSGDEAGTINADGHAIAFVHGEGTLDAVLKSGALDKLDAKTREEVIAALKKAFAAHDGKHQIKVIVKTDDKDEK